MTVRRWAPPDQESEARGDNLTQGPRIGGMVLKQRTIRGDLGNSLSGIGIVTRIGYSAGLVLLRLKLQV